MKNKIVQVLNLGALGILLLTLFSSTALGASQDSWRYCQKCHLLFYDGFPTKGVCPVGGGHVAQGFNFILPYGYPETKQAQTEWRFCKKCYALFYNGFPQKGTCPAGGSHVAEGFVFTLPHDVPSRGLSQDAWHYCDKCHAMFYDGYPNEGRCPAIGAHSAMGFNFVLQYLGNLQGDVAGIPADQ